jgi:DNA-binding GntR family transcriptional regulator
VAESLRHEILEGRLKPGEWLRQERLAQEHGVSHMPVREALKQLAAEGLVEHVPYRGARVVQFTLDDVEDLYECRAFIEGLAARSAAVHISDTQVAELERLHERMAQLAGPDSLDEYRELNRYFHKLIFTASRRSYLVRTLAQLWAAFPTMLWSNFAQTVRTTPAGRDESDVEEHAAIVAALRARDGAAAERAVRRHIGASAGYLLAALRGNT